MEVNEKNFKIYKSIIFRLNKEQQLEKNSEKRKSINLELKDNIEKALEILPNDINLRTNLMYAYIRLNDLNKARAVGEELISAYKTEEIINGLSIIEEKSGNYDKAIEYMKLLLELKPNNQKYVDELEILECKKQNIPIDGNLIKKKELYKKIASLERSILTETEKQQGILERQGINSNKQKILQENYLKIFQQIKEMAESILLMYPREIIAREKLVKALYNIGEEKQAEIEIKDLLNIDNKDEIALWYLSKIQRDNGKIEKEKETLERILNNSKRGTNIKAQKRLERVNNLIEERKIKNQLEQEKQKSYTEESRIEFIDKIQKDFLHGILTKDDISKKIEEARKYPNFDKSLIELLNIKAMMTEDKIEKINALETYIDTEQSLTKESYGRVINEISKTREDIKNDQNVEQYLNEKEQLEKENRQAKAREERKYYQETIQKLSRGEITKENLQEVIKKLETFNDIGKSIFLITKLYEIIYDRNVAYTNLAKYTSMLNLSKEQRKEIADLQKMLTDNDRKFGKTKRIKGIYQKNERKKQRYNKKVQKEEIEQYLGENKTVKQIYNLLKDKGITIQYITRLKSYYIKNNPQKQQEYLQLEEDVKALLKGGYSSNETHEIIEYDVPLYRIKELERQLKQKEVEL